MREQNTSFFKNAGRKLSDNWNRFLNNAGYNKVKAAAKYCDTQTICLLVGLYGALSLLYLSLCIKSICTVVLKTLGGNGYGICGQYFFNVRAH